MTVCVAVGFTWNYTLAGKAPDFGPGAMSLWIE